MSKKKIIIRYTFSFFLIALGVLVGIAIYHYWHFPIEETLNLMDLITLVTTIFLAVYIPEVLDRKLQISRDKKELIEHRLEDLQLQYRRVNLLLQSTEDFTTRDILMINNTLDVCKYRLNTISTLMQYSKMNYSFDKEIKELLELSKTHRKLLWVEDIESKSDVYPMDIKHKEEKLYNIVDQHICLMIFKLSEAN